MHYTFITFYGNLGIWDRVICRIDESLKITSCFISFPLPHHFCAIERSALDGLSTRIHITLISCLASFASVITGKSLSEALIFASTNLQYDNILFIELQVQYMKIPSSNLGRTCCVQKLFLTFRTIFIHNMFSPMFCKKKSF